MLLHANQSNIAEIKKAVRSILPGISSSHASEAIAGGLGFKTNRSLFAAFGKSAELVRPLDEAGFAARLVDISDLVVVDEPLTTAAVRAAPRSLDGQDHNEGILVAVARAIAAERTRMFKAAEKMSYVAAQVAVLRGEAEPEDVNHPIQRSFSLNIEHDGGNNFSAEVAFGENYNMTVAIHDGANDAAVAKLFKGDLDAINNMLLGYDTDWIVNYTAPEDEALIQGKPVLDPGIVAFGMAAQVWRAAAAISRFDNIGNFKEREVIAINEATFERIDEALRSMGSWVGNAHAVQVIIDIAKAPAIEADERPDFHQIATMFPAWKAEYEVTDRDGDTHWVHVETDVKMHCEDLVDRLARGVETDLEGNIEWWAEWGKRLHDAEVEIDEFIKRGAMRPSEMPVIQEADFEVFVFTTEMFVRALNEGTAAEAARNLGLELIDDRPSISR